MSYDSILTYIDRHITLTDQETEIFKSLTRIKSVRKGQFVVEQGFFMNWFGQMDAGQEGFEYHLLVLGISLALIISGGGKYSADLIYYKNITSSE